jgi:hypothetical protein
MLQNLTLEMHFKIEHYINNKQCKNLNVRQVFNNKIGSPFVFLRREPESLDREYDFHNLRLGMDF